MVTKYIAVPAGIMLIISSSAFAAEGESSTINFTGQILDNTCTLSDASKGQFVELGSFMATSFSGTDSTSTPVQFTIELEDCTNNTSSAVEVRFKGETVSGKPDVLHVTGGAENIGIQILHEGEPVDLTGEAETPYTQIGDDQATISIPYEAQYIALDNTVMPGEANGFANFTVYYH